MTTHHSTRSSLFHLSSPAQKTVKPYLYSPFKKRTLNSSIRLLTLLPGSLGTGIYIHLTTVILNESHTPTYEALSYTWGTNEDQRHIYIAKCKGSVLAVNKNLWQALDHLRYTTRPRTLWIDAICINQMDLDERSRQVRRMADIYRLAERVVVWLGIEENGSSLAINMLRTLGTNIEVDWTGMTMKPSDKAFSSGNVHWAERSEPLPFEAEEGTPIHFLLNRTWFERLWIRQEISLAKSNAIVTCGSDIMLWSEFRKSIFCLTYKRAKVGFFRDTFIFKPRLQMIYNLSHKGQLPIQDLIRRTRDCECSDPRDRIYALLSIYHRNLHIVPDYNLSKREVYQGFCHRLIHSSECGNLDILRSCESNFSRSDLPSWVPDWSIQNVTRHNQSDFAAGFSVGDATYLGYGVLRIFGLRVSTIVRVKTIPYFEPSVERTIALIRLLSDEITIDNDKTLEIYCRTLCNNRIRETRDPPRESEPALETSMETLRLFLGSEQVRSPLTIEGNRYCELVNYHLENRSFFITERGQISIGPRGAKPNDLVVVFPGCSSPIVLRSTENGRYRVIGACFIHELSHSQALLGALPEGCDPIYTTTVSRSWDNGYVYVNRKSSRLYTEDPRLESFRHDIDKNGLLNYYATDFDLLPPSTDQRNEIKMMSHSLYAAPREYTLKGVITEPFDLT